MFHRRSLPIAAAAALLAGALEFHWQLTLNALVLKPPAALTAAATGAVAAAFTFLFFWLYALIVGVIFKGDGRGGARWLAAFAAAVAAPQIWFVLFYFVLPPARLAWLAAFGIGLVAAPFAGAAVAAVFVRRGFAAVLGISAAAALAVLSYRADREDRRPASDRRPHVVLVTLDTTRADHLGCYGYAAARTPNLDALAAAGVRFVPAVCLEPITAPSHATIMTSLYPKSTGVTLNGQRLATDAPTLADCFRNAGYETAAFVGGTPVQAKYTGLNRGFAVYDDWMTPAEGYSSTPLIPKKIALTFSLLPRDANDAERPANVVTDAAARWLGKRARGKPFFLWAHYFDPHDDYLPPAAYLPANLGGPLTRRRWNQKWADGFNDDYTRHIIQLYYDGELAFVDYEIGRLLDQVAATTSGEPVIVVVVGDHGEAFWEHGTKFHGKRLYREETDIPFVVSGMATPLPEPAAGVGVVSTLDVAPTVLDLAGIPVPATMMGRKLFSSGAKPTPAYAICVPETRRDRGGNIGPIKGWITADEKLLVPATNPKEYYDLRSDPGERLNLAAETPARVAKLETAMERLSASLPEAAEAPRSADAERDRKLRALGYLR